MEDAGPGFGGTRAGPAASGAAAEALVAERLAHAGWSVLGRNVRVGRDEIDILALDPGPPRRLVIVEVRTRSTRDHGLAEETLTATKQRHLRRAAAALASRSPGPAGPGHNRAPAVDLIVIEPGLPGTSEPRVRHHRDVLAGI